MVVWRPKKPSRTNTKKDVPFIIGDWNAKVVSQEIPGVTGKFGLGVQDEAGQRLTFSLPREYTGHSQHPLSTTQETALHMDTIRSQIPKSDWLYSLQPKMKKLYTVNKNKTWSCGSDHQFLMVKFRLKLKKVGKTTRSLKYDLNQIPYKYTVEVMSKIQGIIRADRQECLKNYGCRFITMNRRQRPKPSQRKRNARRQSVCLRMLYK